MNSGSAAEIGNLRSGRIFVAGHRGMVGSAIVRRLEATGCKELLLRTHAELDLTDGHATRAFMNAERPDYVFLAAAKVGGINANNTYPAEFLHENLMIAANVISAAHACGSRRLLFLGSSCIYPRLAPQPMPESCLLTGALEPTNEPYAIAKIAGMKLCESFNRQYGTDYRSIMPTNLYGPNDNFDLENSHVLPALLRKFHEAKVAGLESVEVWGTGRVRREFLHVDDMADACLFLMGLTAEQYRSATSPMLSQINAGTGKDLTIRELAETIGEIVGYRGSIRFDADRPDGTPQKLLDVSKMTGLGWQAQIALRDGIRDTYAWYLEQGLDG